jgi:hypothetical protein
MLAGMACFDAGLGKSGRGAIPTGRTEVEAGADAEAGAGATAGAGVGVEAGAGGRERELAAASRGGNRWAGIDERMKEEEPGGRGGSGGDW